MKLTPARRSGLQALVEPDPRKPFRRQGRRSNVTDIGLGYVYWQTADWLVEQNLARFTCRWELLELTPAGMELAVRENLGRVGVDWASEGRGE